MPTTHMHHTKKDKPRQHSKTFVRRVEFKIRKFKRPTVLRYHVKNMVRRCNWSHTVQKKARTQSLKDGAWLESWRCRPTSASAFEPPCQQHFGPVCPTLHVVHNPPARAHACQRKRVSPRREMKRNQGVGCMGRVWHIWGVSAATRACVYVCVCVFVCERGWRRWCVHFYTNLLLCVVSVLLFCQKEMGFATINRWGNKQRWHLRSRF